MMTNRNRNALQPLNQLVRQFPLLGTSLFRNRDLWDDLEEGLFSESQQRNGVTIYEQGNQLIVEAELPGARPEDVEITYSKGVLNIRCTHIETEGSEKDMKEEKGGERRYYSRSQRSWAYSVNLPVAVDESNPQASFEDGVMHITFNKAQKDAVKHIPIKKSGTQKR